VRGDLSVVTNDLCYLGTVISPDEVERPKMRCAHIGQVVGKLSILEGALEISPCTVEALLGHDVELREDGADEDRAILLLRCDIKRARFVLDTLASLVGCRGAAHSSRPDKAGQGPVCAISFVRARSAEAVASYPCFSEFAAQVWGERSVVDAALCDLIVKAHGWRSSAVVSETNVELEVDIPLWS
jgi:hypothetical protein